MGAAGYVGRVGGLAVALGVGTAIATGHGVASADTTDSSPPPSTDSSTTEPSTTDTGPVEPTATPDISESETTTETKTTTVTEGVVSAQTNTGTTSGITESTETPETPDEPETAPEEEPTDPTETAEPEPTETEEPTEEPVAPPEEPTAVDTAKPNDNAAPTTAAEPNSTTSARTVTSSDPASAIQEPANAAVFADARALAAAGPINVSPMMAAQTTAATTPAPAPAAAPDLLTAAINVVSSVVNWVLSPLAGMAPTTPAQPPLIWGLLAFARREFENFFSALSGRPANHTELTAQQTTTSLALAAAAVTADPPGTPFPSAQVSPSTQFVGWVTGQYADTIGRYSVWGTDVGTMWDNGIPDDPTTTINEHQILIALGDTFSAAGMTGVWRPNTIFRSADIALANGMDILNGQWKNGNMFGGAPLGPNSTTARQVIFPEGLPAGVTLIPTAGVSVPVAGSRFGAIQYVSFMSVSQWGAPGQWSTNYSALAWSDDNGETFHVAPSTVRYNQPWGGNQNFQQSAFVRPGDGYVYTYGTPNGRQGAAYLARVAEQDILDLTKYDYYSAGSPGGWFGWGATPAGWHRNNPAAATAVFGQDTGACGVANAGNQVSEMSVQYNKSLNKYVTLYGDQFNNIVMRTSDTPQGTWSSAKVLMTQQNGGIYAPMMHPWSPSTQGTGSDLYWNLSLWSEYNVMLMRTDLTKV
jgi:D-arabinan endo alpha-(1,5)-arabinofuranosidase